MVIFVARLYLTYTPYTARRPAGLLRNKNTFTSVPSVSSTSYLEILWHTHLVTTDWVWKKVYCMFRLPNVMTRST